MSFDVGPYDSAKLLVIDPVLVYSTFLGDSADGIDIAVDGNGNAYVTGSTRSTDFPTVNPFQSSGGGGPCDAFVTKLNDTGSALVYSTYLGGSSLDVAFGIAVDSAGNAYVTGRTRSSDFPTENPLQADFGGGSEFNNDAFVTKLDATGSALVYSTYLGGTPSEDGAGDDLGIDIAVDPDGNAYVTGFTTATDFPTVNPLQPTSGSFQDAFVTKFNDTGSALLYSTYLGGNSIDEAHGIAVDVDGNAYVTGFTGSPDFPTSNPLQPTLSALPDVFVTKLNPSARIGLLYLSRRRR